jgi:two-component sensor histidine kinase
MTRPILDRQWVLDAILRQVPEGIIVAEAPNVVVRYISDHAIRLTGRPVSELQTLRGDQVVERWHFLETESRQMLPLRDLPLMRAAAGEGIELAELALERADGTTVPIFCKAGPIRDLDGKIVGCMMSFSDATEEARLRRELREEVAARETLMAEINYRMRNSLSLIASVIGIQAAKTQNPEAKGILLDTRTRCFAFARIHQRVHTAGLGSTVEFSDFLSRLCRDLQVMAGSISKDIHCRIIATPHHLPIAQAVPLALAINELATNAIKYAYPDGSGEIQIEFLVEPGGDVQVAVSDQGVGLPEGFDPERSTGLGMQIVNRFMQQIEARLHVERTNPGTRFTIVSPSGAAA